MKPSTRVIIHGVGMTPMRLIGASSSHRPIVGAKAALGHGDTGVPQ
jgi:hypothetical protein